MTTYVIRERFYENMMSGPPRLYHKTFSVTAKDPEHLGRVLEVMNKDYCRETIKEVK